MKLLYLAGPYSAPAAAGIEANILSARKVATALWERGFAVFCPHLNTARFERDCAASYEDYIAGDLVILSRCDAVVMLPGWRGSPGARREFDRASEIGIPVYFWDAAAATLYQAGDRKGCQ